MVTKRNSAILNTITLVVIVVAFLILGGGDWIKGMTYGGNSFSLVGLKWVQIFISLSLGFLLGLFVSRRRRI